MNAYLNDIFKTRKYVKSDGCIIDIHSETGYDQCLFLQEIIQKNSFRKSIEIGFAYGISTLVITDAVTQFGGTHTVIDKFQNSDWGGVGLDLLAKAGYSEKLSFFEEYSYKVLPQLLDEGSKYDFAYIDSTKQFDWLMVDFFFLDKLIKPGGVIVFDDVVFPGIRKLLRYLSQLPDYKVYNTYPANGNQQKSRKVNLLGKIFPFLERYLKEDYLLRDAELGINTHCVALKKTSNDSRNWDWHKSF